MKASTEQVKKLLAEYAKVTEVEASAFIDAFVYTLIEHLKNGEEVTVSGLGVFHVVDNQQGKRVAFRPEEKLKMAVNAPFAFFEPLVIQEKVKYISPTALEEDEVVEMAEPAVEPTEEETMEELVEERAEEPQVKPAPVVELTPEPEPEPALELKSELESKPEPKPAPKPKRVAAKSSIEKYGIVAALACVFVLGIVGVVMWINLSGETKPQKPAVTAQVTCDAPIDTVATATPSAEPVATTTEPTKPVEPKAEPVANTQVATTVEKPTPAETKSVEAKAPRVVEISTERPTNNMLMLNADGTPQQVELQPGERLTVLAERLYGDKCFWGYIFEVNAFQLNNPNNVPSGKKLYLPNAQYYRIDAKDEASLRRGRQKQMDIQRAYGLY